MKKILLTLIISILIIPRSEGQTTTINTIPQIANGLNFDADISDGKIYLISNNYYELDLQGNITYTNTDINDTGQGAYDFGPALEVGLDGSIHVIHRDGGDKSSGFNLRYSKRESSGIWGVERNLVGSPFPRNYVVDIVGLEDGSALYAHGGRTTDNVYGSVFFYTLNGLSTDSLGEFGTPDYYRADSDFRMEEYQNHLHIAVGNPIPYGYVHYMNSEISSTLVDDLVSSVINLDGAGEYSRRGQPDLKIDKEGNTYISYGDYQSVFFDKYSHDGASDIHDQEILTDLGDWHMHLGLSAISASHGGDTILLVGMETGGDPDIASSCKLLFTYSYDGGQTWTSTVEIPDYRATASEGRSRPRIHYFDNKFYVFSSNSSGGIGMSVIDLGEELPVPEQPIALAATNITASGFTANWEASEGATGYVLSGATEDTFADEVILESWDGDVYSYDATGLEPGTEYFYRVRATNLAGSSTYGNVISLSTEKGAQSITFDALNAVSYGDNDFELPATATSGLVVSYSSSDDNIATVTGSTVSIVRPGTVTITASQDGDAQYLAANPVDRDLVVKVKDLTVINASAENKVYDGNTDAVVSGATLNGVVAGDDVSLTGANAGVFAKSGVGTAIVVATSMDISGADVARYNFVSPGDFTADITARELVVTAEDKNREECADNPEFTLTYSGFAGTEDESVLDQEATADCAADAGSPAGDYNITASGGAAANYTLVYATGTLTISQDDSPPYFSAQNFTLQLDASNTGVLLASDVVTDAADNCAVVDTTLSKFIFTDADIGDVNVDVTVSDAAGNEITGTIVVTVLGNVTGIKDAEALEGRAYPNPTYGLLYLELNEFADEFAVMDITGKTVLWRTDPGKEIAIDLSDFNSGIYVINVKTGEKDQYFKVVKK